MLPRSLELLRGSEPLNEENLRFFKIHCYGPRLMRRDDVQTGATSEPTNILHNCIKVGKCAVLLQFATLEPTHCVNMLEGEQWLARVAPEEWETTDSAVGLVRRM